MTEFDTAEMTDNLIVVSLLAITGYTLYTLVRWTDEVGGGLSDFADDHWWSFREIRVDARRLYDWLVAL